MEPKKDYFPPMHTVEHILNQVMVRKFGCARSVHAHIEKKKSKCDYFISEPPSEEQMKEVETQVNEVIQRRLPVEICFMEKDEAEKIMDTAKLPDGVDGKLRIVKVGDFDACPCIGEHVSNTSEIGRFKFISYDHDGGRLRVRFRLEEE
ncbi:Threonyl and Alanyl tRNA synthetase second additional domain-containing protein [Parelusimicrobium proximum]|uniref:hypothetical protein n=1 Tax=Parelusimicrobium proximum TaxID=3228953 RepID=UPI003D184C53